MKIDIIKGTLDSNTFIVSKGTTVLVIDAGAEIRDISDALGSRAPSAILLTHGHHDHTTHISDYASKFDCPIYCHPQIGEDLGIGQYHGDVKDPSKFNNFKSISDENDFKVGDLKIKPILCPGHSAASIAYMINGNLFTGDVLFNGTIGRTDLMENGHELMKNTLKKLLKVKYKTAWHGHGRSSTYKEQHRNIKLHL